MTYLRLFTKFLVVATLFLIFLGGQVKSNEAGLAVPDWPTSYGEPMFAFGPANWVGGIFHEHVHRLVASSVGMMCIVLVFWLMYREERRWVKTLGWVALAGVILQGLLGGLTVIFMLPVAISTSHAVLAQTFFLVTILIAYSLSRERAAREQENQSEGYAALVAPVLFMLGAVYVQLILGALMRHTESGLAIPDFPSMGGQYLPVFTPETLAWINDWRYDQQVVANGQFLEPVTLGQVWIHFIHRLGAFVVLCTAIIVTFVGWQLRGSNVRVWRTVCSLDAVVAIQIGLGISTVLLKKTPVVTSVHVMTGAALLGFTALLALRVLPLQLGALKRSEENEPGLRPIAS